MKIIAVLFPGMTALDLVGPLQVLGFFPGAEIQTVWKHDGPVRSDNGLQLVASHSFENAYTDPDILIIGGAAGPTLDMMRPSPSSPTVVRRQNGWSLSAPDR